MSVRLVLASGNRHKVVELERAIATLGALAGAVTVIAAAELGEMPDVVEDRDTFAGNAILKAHGFARWLAARGESPRSLVLADDSGLCVDALGGQPGVYSARFAGGHASDEANNRRLVQALEEAGVTASPAHYVCALALARVDGGPLPGANDEGVCIFTGRWDGEARTVARGDGGFGYDPHVWLEAADGARTVAELSPEAKTLRSHRGVATRALLAALPQILASIA